MKISAVTFNLQNGQSWEDENPDCSTIDFPASVEFLRSLDADVYFLQEVERGFDGGAQIHPPPNFSLLQAGFPDYDSAFTYPPKNPDELPFGIGLAILSRWPLQIQGSHVLPASDLEFEFDGRQRRPSERSILRASIQIGEQALQLVNTHLQAYFMIGSTSLEYPEQRNHIEALVRALGVATLLGGDFNSSPEDDLATQLEAAGYCSAQTEVPTWKRRPYVVDHLFYGAALNVESCEVIETATSDHHAVRAVFDFAE